MPGTLVGDSSATPLSPLTYAKGRVANQLESHALRGDAALSGIGAAVGLLAVIGLGLDDAFDWWWADRVAALLIAAVAAAEAVRAHPFGR